MFESDTKEKNTNEVDVVDVDSESFVDLYVFRYNGEDMEPEEAQKLYTAADKYGVLSVKQHCSTVLKKAISVANLSDLYMLADMHQDRDLKTAVESYVFIYMNTVFPSSEWKRFMQLSTRLSGIIMHKLWLKTLLSKKNVYLTEDILSMECYIVGKVNDVSIPNDCETDSTPEQSLCIMKGLGKDILHLYTDSKFCDVKIKTHSQVFSVHKTVICARSPVFSAMFDSDTKERNTNEVDVVNVDSEIMNLLLTYMYSDTMEDMKPEEAQKLYTAADKYGVLPVKQHCLTVLKKAISVANLSDIYMLADMHQDSDLKTAVEGYVFIYMNVVFPSSEWKHFMRLSPHLSGIIMHKLWLKLNGS